MAAAVASFQNKTLTYVVGSVVATMIHLHLLVDGEFFSLCSFILLFPCAFSSFKTITKILQLRGWEEGVFLKKRVIFAFEKFL